MERESEGWRDGSEFQALTVLAEDLGSILNTTSAHKPVTTVPGDPVSSSDFCRPQHAHGTHIYFQAKQVCTENNNTFRELNKIGVILIAP